MTNIGDKSAAENGRSPSETWWVGLPQDQHRLERLEPWAALPGVLDGAFLQELRRFQDPADRLSRAVAHALMRLRAGRLLGRPPAQIRAVTDQPRGKPRLPGCGLEFSLSHCRTGVCVAFSFESPVGVDVEPLRLLPPSDLPGLLSSVLTPDEQVVLHAVGGHPGPGHPFPGESSHAAPVSHAFLHWWTLKEAVLKCTGEGLSRDLHSFEVRPDRQPPEVTFLAHEGRGTGAGAWHLEQWHLEQWQVEGHVVALARCDRAGAGAGAGVAHAAGGVVAGAEEGLRFECDLSTLLSACRRGAGLDPLGPTMVG